MVATATTRACPQCGTGCQDTHQYCPTCGFPVGNVSHTSEDRMIGRTLPGGYHILELISVGGMGRVYRAEQSVLGRTVAVKIIHPHLLSATRTRPALHHRGARGVAAQPPELGVGLRLRQEPRTGSPTW
jgi:hypothetical protein